MQDEPMAMTHAAEGLDAPDIGVNRFAQIASLPVRQPILALSCALLLAFGVTAVVSPWITADPAALDPLNRLQPPSLAEPFGTDQVGRSVFARALVGTRVSLSVGIAVAVLTTLIGVCTGVIAGYFRSVDKIVMRAMDAVMAIPAILLAIALVALIGASPIVIVTAISLPEIPRMARVVRASVLSLRERVYVEAAITCGGRTVTILHRHILPGAAGPIMVQSTYVFASAMILESILSFLGAGTPPDVPSWGNMMSEGRQFLQIAPWILGFPALMLAMTVLAANLLGDVLRDLLDPSFAGGEMR
ncbi:ABC transporter permease [Bradyrhizobium yuanmingense]|uniref:ABC transporter permease n=1 Tax=Bradyrhizobium yuanmingense TaxID=108015 RepID=UPI0023B9F45C|nr:ABC transporter permease [Bradyrhizobium yuanmingense]MDF0520469.1 ABC transporter permease [Bradyrhizobium yuanmingense]